jgi:hypothetical protein
LFGEAERGYCTTGVKKQDAENNRHIIRIICGDNFAMRRINGILAANYAEKQHVFIRKSKLANFQLE